MSGHCIGMINQFRLDEQTGCWNWTGTLNRKDGYGYSHWKGKQVLAHRLSAMLWLRFNINSPLRVLHRCDNPRCINPKHLFFGTLSVNTLDSIAKGRHFEANKTHCKNGHEFSVENTYRHGNNWRACRACKREYKLGIRRKLI